MLDERLAQTRIQIVKIERIGQLLGVRENAGQRPSYDFVRPIVGIRGRDVPQVHYRAHRLNRVG